MAHQDELKVVQEAVQREREAHAGWRRALARRDRAVRRLFAAAADLGPTEIGKAVGLTPSTVRGITRDLAAERRDG